MTLAARLSWFLVVLSLVAGGIAVFLVSDARSAAAEERRAASRRLAELEAEYDEQLEQISDIKEDQKERKRVSRECFFVVVAQLAALNELGRDIRANVSRPSELDRYADVAREMVLDFRKLMALCFGD